jgi:hypothetical protein
VKHPRCHSRPLDRASSVEYPEQSPSKANTPDDSTARPDDGHHLEIVEARIVVVAIDGEAHTDLETRHLVRDDDDDDEHADAPNTHGRRQLLEPTADAPNTRESCRFVRRRLATSHRRWGTRPTGRESIEETAEVTR